MFFLMGTDDLDETEAVLEAQATVPTAITEADLATGLAGLRNDLVKLRGLRVKNNAAIAGVRFGQVSPIEARAFAAYYREPRDEEIAIDTLAEVAAAIGDVELPGPIEIVDEAMSGFTLLPIVSLSAIAGAIYLGRPAVTRMLEREKQLFATIFGKWAALPSILRWVAVAGLGLIGIWVGAKAVKELRA